MDQRPDPFCGSCEDYGLIEIFHPSTDGLIGHRECDDTACIERRARVAREHRPPVRDRIPYDCPF